MNADARTISLVADRLCLNFVNTVDCFAKAQPKEYLRSYADLVGWSEHVGSLSASEAQALLAKAEHRPADAAAALHWAKEMRLALYQTFVGIAAAQPIPAHVLDVLNRMIDDAPPRTRLIVSNGVIAWARGERSGDLYAPTWEIVHSAVDLLTSPEAAYVRECEGEGCSWTFLDTSRGRTRRWCSMGWCGNRAKARRHYQRQRS